jgi:hypothetical protein
VFDEGEGDATGSGDYQARLKTGGSFGKTHNTYNECYKNRWVSLDLCVVWTMQ